MKTWVYPFILSLLLISLPAVAQQRVGSGQMTIISAASGTPTAWTNAPTFVHKVTILGKKSARAANTGTVYIGPTSGNDTQPFEITTGAEVVLEAADGTLLNLADWYVDVVTNDDGVILIFH
jgi:hypothetical protein